MGVNYPVEHRRRKTKDIEERDGSQRTTGEGVLGERRLRNRVRTKSLLDLVLYIKGRQEKVGGKEGMKNRKKKKNLSS